MQLPNRQGVSFLPPGTKLGKYEIIRGVAVGGMAELYLARTAAVEEFDRLVALKRILPQFAADEEFVRMFLDEARLTAKLDHPNIAKVYDIGMDTGGLFFTMEFVHGENVQTLLRTADIQGTPVPLAIAVAIARKVAAGLYAAHEQRGADGRTLGIVHRDVSPSNVVVSFDGNVKLIDFGVAKARGRHTKTKSGTIKGKVSYMSPEQCRGEPLDHRSDVFALGILLYELSTTEKLFMADNEFALIGQIAYEDVRRPSQRFPHYPRDLEDIVMRAMSRRIERRYQNMRELEHDLDEFARRHSLDISSAALSEYMRDKFAESFHAWESMLVDRARVKTPGARPRGKRNTQRDLDHKRDPDKATVRLYHSSERPEDASSDAAVDAAPAAVSRVEADAAAPEEIAPSVTEPLELDALEELDMVDELVMVEEHDDADSPDSPVSAAAVQDEHGDGEDDGAGAEAVRYAHAATVPPFKGRWGYRYAVAGMVAAVAAAFLIWAGISSGTASTAAGTHRALADSPPAEAGTAPVRRNIAQTGAGDAGENAAPSRARKSAADAERKARDPAELTAQAPLQAMPAAPSASTTSTGIRRRQSRHAGKEREKEKEAGQNPGSIRLLDVGAARTDNAQDQDAPWDPDSPLPPP